MGKAVVAVAGLAVLAAVLLASSGPLPSWPVFRAAMAVDSLLTKALRRGTPPNLWLMNQAYNFQMTKTLYIACKYRIPDYLKDGPLSVQALSKLAGTDPKTTDRVMKYLAVQGVFALSPEQLYSNNAASDFMRVDHPQSVRPLIVFVNEMYKAMEGLDATMEDSSKMMFQVAFNTTLSFWDYWMLPENKELKEAFDLSMVGISNLEFPALLHDYDWQKHGTGTIVDVGGGVGHLTATLLRSFPLSGVVTDTEVDSAKAYWQQHYADVVGRVQFVQASFFDSVWPGGDVYILKHILHDWDDGLSTAILRKVAAAMKETVLRSPSKRPVLLLIDGLYDFPPDIAGIAGLDLMMLVFNGKERSKAEFAAVCAQAGLSVVNVVKTRSMVAVLEVELA